jgi:hypothetical protein
MVKVEFYSGRNSGFFAVPFCGNVEEDTPKQPILIKRIFCSLHSMTNKKVDNYFDDFAKKNA